MDSIHLPQNCREAPSCLDYRNYVFPLPLRPAAPDYAIFENGLRKLGVIKGEGLGVTRVGGDWGFVTIPPPGFPELRVSLYHHTDDREAEDILQRIEQIANELNRSGGA